MNIDNMKIKNLKQIYIAMSIEKKAFLWFAICNFVQKSIAFITVPIFTRIMPASEYGIYAVYQSWYLIISIFTTFNLSSGVYNKGLIKFNRDNFTLSMVILSNLITTVWLFIYLCSRAFWENISGLSSILIFSMFIDSFFGILIQFWTARQRFEYKYKSMVIVTIMTAVVSTIISLLAVIISQNKANVRVLSMVLVNAIIGIVIYCLFVIRGRTVGFIGYCKYAIKFNLPLIPHYLSLIVLQQSDRIFIAKMAGEDKAAIYSIAYSVSTIMVFAINALTSAFTPYVYNNLKNNQSKKISDVTNKLLLVVAGMNLCVILFGPEIISFFAPKQYSEAIWAIPPVATSVFFMFFYNVFTIVEFYYEKTSYVMMASVLGAILNIILNYIFISKFGYIAAAYTTLICYILFAILHYYYANRVLKNNNHKFGFNTRYVCIVSLFSLSELIIMLPLYNNIFLRYLVIIILFLIMVLNRKKLIILTHELLNK